MVCNNCKTLFDLVTIDSGKSKFCRSCGSVLYRNINGNIVFETGIPAINNQFDLKNDEDAAKERLKQEMLIKQRQLEIEQQKQAETYKIRQEQLILHRQAEIEREKTLEAEQQRQLDQQKLKQAEKLRQEQLIKERQLELQRQKETEVLRLAEIEKQQALEFAKQQQIRLEKQIEQERLEKEQQEKAFREREIHIQKEYELELQREKERALIELQRQEREQEDLQKEKETELQRYRDKEIEGEAYKQKSNWWKYLLVSIIALAIGAGGYFLIDTYILHKEITINPDKNVISENIAALLTPEKIIIDLIDKDIIGWGKVEINDITAIQTEKQARNDSIICTSTLSLMKNNVKSKAEVSIFYTDTVATNVKTNKITYQNTAPAMSWFNFTPVQNCDIFINTNNNPIQLKTCENCELLKLNTNNETLHKLVINPAGIFISSDNKFDAIVDFIYIPKN